MYTIDDLNKKMIENLKFNAVRSLNEQAQFNIDGNGNVIFHGEYNITNKDIEDEMSRLQQLWDDHEYARLRVAEYPNFIEYIDGVVKGNTTQTQAYVDACLAVKAKYPKP